MYNFTDLQGNFTSPNYPNNYPHNLKCTWIITVPSGYYVYLYFHHFNLEGGYNCPYDYVEVFDRNSSTNSTIKRCSYQSTWCVYSTSSTVYVRFVTDGSVSRSGFTAHYESVNYRYPLKPMCAYLNGLFTSSIQATKSKKIANIRYKILLYGGAKAAITR